MKVYEAETIAVKALTHLAADPEGLDRFLALTGIAPDELASRARAADHALLTAVLEHYLNFEPDLMAFCQAQQLKPSAPAEAARLLAAGTSR